jgi:hypothetical protein
MAGLDPAIHVLVCLKKEDVGARVKPGHDGVAVEALVTLVSVAVQS